jgi:hypothetical protein
MDACRSADFTGSYITVSVKQQTSWMPIGSMVFKGQHPQAFIYISARSIGFGTPHNNYFG